MNTPQPQVTRILAGREGSEKVGRIGEALRCFAGFAKLPLDMVPKGDGSCLDTEVSEQPC
jgi:hypothetical protein